MIPASCIKHRHLILQMTKREIMGRYRGSVLGLGWSFFHPLLMLAVYTFVFGVVFKARWHGDESGSKIDFAIVLFVGMIVHRLFAECMEKSPELILANANFVKKVVFPLEIFAPISLLTSLFHCAISFLVLCVAIGLTANLHPSILLAPIVLLPLALLTLGVSWFLSALGVYVRDIGQVTGILSTIMMFLSPMFYPVAALPEAVRPLIMLNPLSFIMEQARAVLIWGRMPDWSGIAVYTLGALVLAWTGYVWFQKTRKGFADVL